MTPTFKFRCSFMGSTWYDVRDETGVYEAEFRRDLSDYEAQQLNGIDCVLDCLAAVGIFRRAHSTTAEFSAWKENESAPLFAAPQSTVDAFNTWRTEERATHIADMQGQPNRYGEINPSDSTIFPPIMPARRGCYVMGSGWQWQGKGGQV